MTRRAFAVCVLVAGAGLAQAQEARRRWETLCQIRKDKFDLILPEAMRENGIDMWIVQLKEGHQEPLYEDMGQRLTYEIRPTNLFSIEFFAYTPAPEWGGKKVRIPLEDDAIATPRGIEWLYPPNARILLVK